MRKIMLLVVTIFLMVTSASALSISSGGSNGADTFTQTIDLNIDRSATFSGESSIGEDGILAIEKFNGNGIIRKSSSSGKEVTTFDAMIPGNDLALETFTGDGVVVTKASLDGSSILTSEESMMIAENPGSGLSVDALTYSGARLSLRYSLNDKVYLDGSYDPTMPYHINEAKGIDYYVDLSKGTGLLYSEADAMNKINAAAMGIKPLLSKPFVNLGGTYSTKVQWNAANNGVSGDSYVGPGVLPGNVMALTRTWYDANKHVVTSKTGWNTQYEYIWSVKGNRDSIALHERLHTFGIGDLYPTSSWDTKSSVMSYSWTPGQTPINYIDPVTYTIMKTKIKY